MASYEDQINVTISTDPIPPPRLRNDNFLPMPDYGKEMFLRMVEEIVSRLNDDEWRRVKERRDA